MPAAKRNNVGFIICTFMMSYLYIWRQKYKFFMEQPKYFNKKSLTTIRLFIGKE